jgi:D-glycero-D-manno-heptose 1,7-bisphosphate phosphatase
MQKIIFLDRDGVINQESRLLIKNPSEWLPIPGSLEAIAALTQAGWKIGVATNQPGISGQAFSTHDLDEIHQHMLALVKQAGGKIDKICYCPHLAASNCACRKPQPAMINQLMNFFSLQTSELQNIRFVGDSVCDIELALATGCIPTLVRSGDGLDTLTKLSRAQVVKTEIYDDLLTLTNHLLKP